jgi:predicted outer membrane repeat protein
MGGGLFVKGSGKLTLDGSTEIRGNVANGSSGGMYLESGTVELKGTTQITENTADTTGGGIFTTGGTLTFDGTPSIHGNTARNGGGIAAKNTALTLSAGISIYNNTATQKGGGIYLYTDEGKTASLTVTGFAKSPIRNNIAGDDSGSGTAWENAYGRDIYAVGTTTTVTISATEDDGKAEYWFADYAENATDYPGNAVFAGDNGNPGRYDPNTTPITYACRSFDGNQAVLALALGYEPGTVNLTLTKTLKAGETAAENTTFIFYVVGVDDKSFQMPVTVNIAKDGTTGTVTLTGLPLGIYDIYEDESWSWRYVPNLPETVNAENVEFHKVANGDDYIRVTTTLAESDGNELTFTNGIEKTYWLSDGKYLPFLAPAQTRSIRIGDDDEDEETE